MNGEAATVLVGHGSRIAEANAAFLAFADVLRDATRLPVEPAFVELARPTVPEALARAAAAQSRAVVVLPFVFFAAGHVKSDLPLHIASARRRYPAVRFLLGTPLGLHRRLLEILEDRVRAVLRGAGEGSRETTGILLVGRGSSDPDANADLAKVARLFWEGRRFLAVEIAFSGVTRPAIPEALVRLARLRPKRIVVLPYLFFAGVLDGRLRADAERFQRAHPWIEVRVAEPIGGDRRLVEVVLERRREALEGSAAMTCDLCKYKVELAGFEEEVGGERALARSRLHAVLGAAPGTAHSHGPLRKHVFVCVNSECVAQGSARVLAELRQRLRAAGLDRSIQTTKASCLRRCGDGPLLVVYPDGVWYRRVAPADLEEIVEVHFRANRPVARLLDQVLAP